MSKVLIITDSASDISVEMEKELGIKVLPFKVALGDQSYVSRVDFDNEQFYKMVEEFDGIPTTSQITPFDFEEMYLEFAKEGYTDIFMILINSKGSATYNNSVFAKTNFYEEYPEYEGKINIYNYDGKGYNGSYAVAVVKAAEALKEGKSVDEVKTIVEEYLSKTKLYFGMYTLKYAGKSGRIPSAAAFVGDTIGLKPIMQIWDGEITTAGKARGEKKLMTTIINMSIEDMEEGSPYSIAYGSDTTIRDELVEKLTEKLGYGPEYMFQIGAAITANAGPKVIGVVINSKERC